MKRTVLIVLVASAAIAAFAFAPGGASLSTWVGSDCRIYLSSSFDPRAKPSYTTESGSSGLETVDNYPTSVRGVIVEVDATAIVVRAEQGLLWIPREQIRVIQRESTVKQP